MPRWSTEWQLSIRQRLPGNPQVRCFPALCVQMGPMVAPLFRPDSKLGTAYHGTSHRFHPQLRLNRAINRKVLKRHGTMVVLELERALNALLQQEDQSGSCLQEALDKRSILAWGRRASVYFWMPFILLPFSTSYPWLLKPSMALTKLQMARHV